MACTKASREVEETSAPIPRTEPAPAAPTTIAAEEPSPAPGSDCYVRSDLRATSGPYGLTLEFTLVNHDTVEKTVTLTGRCPRGLITVHGLPAGADPMHACRAGACAKPHIEQTFRIPANGRVVLGDTVIQPGGDGCNPPLPPGVSWLSASVTPVADSPEVCTGKDAGIEYRDGTVRILSTPPPPPPPQQPTKKPRETKQETTPPAPAPAPKKQRKDCPACGIGCTGNTFPKRGVGPDGCPYCGCEDPFGPTIETRPKPAPPPAP